MPPRTHAVHGYNREEWSCDCVYEPFGCKGGHTKRWQVRRECTYHCNLCDVDVCQACYTDFQTNGGGLTQMDAFSFVGDLCCRKCCCDEYFQEVECCGVTMRHWKWYVAAFGIVCIIFVILGMLPDPCARKQRNAEKRRERDAQFYSSWDHAPTVQPTKEKDRCDYSEGGGGGGGGSCLVPGTLILTSEGPRAVEAIELGDVLPGGGVVEATMQFAGHAEPLFDVGLGGLVLGGSHAVRDPADGGERSPTSRERRSRQRRAEPC